MSSRLELQTKLEELLGSRNVYYQPPESLKINYPAIVYSREEIRLDRANNGIYMKHNRYNITVISQRPDNEVIEKILELPYCSYDRSYKSDNLNHDVLTLFF